MKKTMHKISAVAIAVVMLICAMVVPAFADPGAEPASETPKANGGAYVTKDFRMAEGVEGITRTFQIAVAKSSFDGSATSEALDKMPDIENVEIEVGPDAAGNTVTTTDGVKHYVATKNIFDGVTFDQPGIYEYTVSEVQGAVHPTEQETITYSPGVYKVKAAVAIKEVPVIDPVTGEQATDPDTGDPLTEEKPVVDEAVVVIVTPDNEDQEADKKVDPEQPTEPSTEEPTEAPTEDPEAPTQDPEAPTAEPSTETPEQPTPGGDGGNGFRFTNTYSVESNDDPDDNQTSNPENPDKPFINPDIFDNGLYIGKEVTGKFGNTDQKFNFNVTVTKPALPGHDSDTADAFIVNADNSLEEQLTVTYGTAKQVQLSSGQKLVFSKVYYGSKWTAAETNGTENGYTVSEAVVSGGKAVNAANAPFIVSNAGANSHVFTNDKDEDPGLTGVLINNLPYFIVFALAIAGIAFYFVAKRRRQDEE